MSQYIPHYQSPELSALSRRPTAVTVIAVLGIIFGSLGVLARSCAIPLFFVNLVPRAHPNPLHSDPVYVTYYLGELAIGLVLNTVALWASIKALNLVSRARIALIWYGAISLILDVFSVLMRETVLKARIAAAANVVATGVSRRSTTPANGALSGIHIFVWVAWALALVWSIVVIYVMRRPDVVAAFNQETQAHYEI